MNEFSEQEYQTSKIDFKIWKKIFKIAFTNKIQIVIMIISAVCLAALDVIYPLLNSYAIDNFFDIPDPSIITDQQILGFMLAYLGVALGYGVFVTLFLKIAGKVEIEVSYKLRKEAFDKLQELPFGYYDKTPAGWIMARLTSDSRRLSEIISWSMVDLVWSLLTMLAILVILYVLNPTLALIITCVLPVLLFISFFLQKKILSSYRDVRKINSNITAKYNEGILGSKTTKTLVLENKNSEEFGKECNNYRRQSIKAIIYTSIFFPLILFLGYIGVAVTLRVGGNMVISDVIDIALLYLFITYTVQFFDPIQAIARVFGNLQQAQASAERLMSLIEEVPEILDNDEVIEKYGTILNPNEENYEPLEGDIEFKNVTFQYIEGEVILDNFNLKVKKGTSVALVGATGSGKSTIVNLICRFYEPTSGTILIDGKDYRERSIGWLHSNLGYVLQSPHLFKGTILDNIKYGRMDASDEEAYEAAKLVGADTFIETFDEKYLTDVGDGGSRLSVGQRQLISFARAILSNPSILILDEATSSIDTTSEKIVQDATEELLQGRTSFIVAHRLSTIINANIILVINDGKIIEQGTHRQLLDKRGAYFNLYKNQFMKERMEETKL